jgi:hypothetical protein
MKSMAAPGHRCVPQAGQHAMSTTPDLQIPAISDMKLVRKRCASMRTCVPARKIASVESP